jgi:hypothetical protein
MGIIDFIKTKKEQFKTQQNARLDIEATKSAERTAALKEQRISLEKKAATFEKETKEKERYNKAKEKIKAVKPNKLAALKKGLAEMKQQLPAQSNNPFKEGIGAAENEKANPWK